MLRMYSSPGGSAVEKLLISYNLACTSFWNSLSRSTGLFLLLELYLLPDIFV